MWWLLALVVALLAAVFVVLNPTPLRCPACRRINLFRRTPTGRRHEQRDAEDILLAASTEVACRRCGARYWITRHDYEGTSASLTPPGDTGTA